MAALQAKPGHYAGCDEAGRGCLAGPVFAAAVILPPGFCHPLIIDSKALSPGNREKARRIIEGNALAFAVASVEAAVIDRVNILQASILAMHQALSKLPIVPGFILVDGNYFRPYQQLPHACVIRGDSIHPCISAASILAKTHRDEFMRQIHEEFPRYGWHDNKGYPTSQHLKALQLHGSTPYHRKSFHPVSQLLIQFS